MAKVNNPTLYNISQEEMLDLQKQALKITGKRSVSKLVRHLAQFGFIHTVDTNHGPKEALVLLVQTEEIEE